MTTNYTPPDWTASTPRYTTLADVKQRLGIPTLDTQWDDQITQAIVAGEVAMDAHLGRSFPDPAPDGPIQAIPEAVKQVALQVAVAVYQNGSAPFGSAGSESFALGVVDVPAIVAGEITRQPLLVGLQVEFGVA